MNPETNPFERLPDETSADDPRPDWLQFHEGEIILLKGTVFRVRKVTQKDVVLRPVRDMPTNLETDRLRAELETARRAFDTGTST